MSEVQSLPDQIERIGHAIKAGELARMLAVSRVTIFKQAAAGRIPSFRVGTCVRFDPKAVASWLRRCRTRRLRFKRALQRGCHQDAGADQAGNEAHGGLVTTV
jgi:excisionase family DNA binding protein